MGKRLFLLLLFSIMSLNVTPDFLTAADTFEPKLPDFNVVETVLPEVKEEVKPEVRPEVQVIQNTYVGDSINIAGRNLSVIDVANTSVDSGNHVNKYGDKFLYGHNSGAVFGGLAGLGEGSTFSVTYGGVTTNYAVAKVVIFEKNAETGKLQLDGFGDYMLSVVNARSERVQYDLSIMTCSGTSYGNGDASHRLVLFAYAI